MKKKTLESAFWISFLLCTLLILSACNNEPQNTYKYVEGDLNARGLTSQDSIVIVHMKEDLASKNTTECPASNLQSFLRIIDAVTQSEPVSNIEPNVLSSSYRKLEFTGSTVDGYIVAEIDGKAYVQRSDGTICDLDDDDYKFILDFCSVVLPYPEGLNTQELLSVVKEAVAHFLPQVRQPEDVNFLPPDVQTIQDFYVTDSPPYSLSDVEAPDGTYIAIVPCGYYYEVQIGLVDEDGRWTTTGLRIARSNIKILQDCTSKDLRAVIFGPSITDVSGWGMAQTDKVELFKNKTGEVLWKTDGICFVGDLIWSKNERYMAFISEVGRAEKRGSQLIIVDTADMTSRTHLSPNGAVPSSVQALEWIDNTKLRLHYQIKGQESRELVYNTVTDRVEADSDRIPTGQNTLPEAEIDPALVKITLDQAETLARKAAAALCGQTPSLLEWNEDNLYCTGNYLYPNENNGAYPIEEMDKMHRYDEGKIIWDSPVYSVHFVDGEDGIGTYLKILVDAQTGEIVGGVISGE